MVLFLNEQGHELPPLSVLALSSRFDGRGCCAMLRRRLCLSVLALSSRFDGLKGLILPSDFTADFQYSLCRVVLMVAIFTRRGPDGPSFSTRSVESF